MNRTIYVPTFPKILQDFFCIYLMDQKNVSSQTVVSYRDTFRLLLLFIRELRCREPSDLALTDINADLTLEFLNYLEKERGNCTQTRNARSPFPSNDLRTGSLAIYLARRWTPFSRHRIPPPGLDKETV